jgi:hypothetical protein
MTSCILDTSYCVAREHESEHMETDIPVAEWPSARDVARVCDVGPQYISWLVARGRIRAVKTRLGYLVDPASAAEWQAARMARKAEKKTRAS